MSDHLLTRSILLISCLPVLGAAIYALIIFRRMGKALQLFSFFLFLSALVQVISTALWWYRVNNMPLLHLYVAVGFPCIALYYRDVLREVLDPRILLLLAAAFVLFAIVNSLFFQSIFRFNSRALTVESVIVIIFSLSTFLLSLRGEMSAAGVSGGRSLQWISSGLLVYYASDLLIFYFGDVFTRAFPVYLNQYTWVLHSFFSVIMYTCFIIALWKRPTTSVS